MITRGQGGVGALVVGVALVAQAMTLAGTAHAADEDTPAVAIEPSAPLPPLPPPTPLPPPSAAPAPAPLAPVEPPKAAKPPCDTPCEDDTNKRPTRGSGYLGVRTQYTSAKGSAASRESLGVAAAGAVEVYNDESGILVSRTALAFALGSGSGGLEGLFGGALLVGARVRVSPNHGPFARLGLSGEYQGSSRYLYSRFDLPLVELGYQFVEGTTLFEIGGRLSPVLTGRLRAGSEQHALNNAVSYGAFLAARGEVGRIEITYTRQTLLLDAASAPVVSTFQGRGCLAPFSVFVACLEGQILAGTRGPFGDDPAIATVGGTLGFGAFGTPSSRSRGR